MSFEPYTLLAGFIFGMIGWGIFRYGRAMELPRTTFIGMIMMAYPYFVPNKYAVWIVGVVLCAISWWQRNE